ncbi:hypothetical protein SORBI_3002G173700 [Sorghum bicolor]|uniref:Uncharacterized protein n=1 Tax=Sorghum bicolor TaxID=4558 RepID=A0A1B6QC18_SORBI|nr:hypothetical protein SORBI_3002G173700 [Sorghum bicolor]
MAALEANREWLQAKVSINNALVTEATAHHRANATTARRFLPRRRVRGPEDLNRRRAKNAAGPDAGDGGAQRPRGSRGRAEGQPGVAGGQGYRQQRRPAARLRRPRRRGVRRRRGGPGVAGHPVHRLGAAYPRPRPRLDRQRGTPRAAVRLLPSRDGADQGVSREGDTVLRGTAAGARRAGRRRSCRASGSLSGRALQEFPEMVEELDAKRLRYTLTALSRNDNRSMRGRGWEDAFGTSDKAEAENRAKALGMDVEWLPDGSAKTILGRRRLTRVFPGPRGPQDVVQHGGGDARQGGELCHGGRRQRDPGELCSADRGDHRGGEHPVPVAEGRHPHPRQPRHAPRAPAVVAA